MDTAREQARAGGYLHHASRWGPLGISTMPAFEGSSQSSQRPAAAGSGSRPAVGGHTALDITRPLGASMEATQARADGIPLGFPRWDGSEGPVVDTSTVMPAEFELGASVTTRSGLRSRSRSPARRPASESEVRVLIEGLERVDIQIGNTIRCMLDAAPVPILSLDVLNPATAIIRLHSRWHAVWLAEELADATMPDSWRLSPSGWRLSVLDGIPHGQAARGGIHQHERQRYV